MIDPAHLGRNEMPPLVHIDMARANGTELKKASNSVVRPGAGELEFHYVGLSYIAPSRIQYRYKLDGYDKFWVEAGNRRSAFYTNLKPGPYRFMVQACNEDGAWNTAGDEFDLRLLPHFYQTGWFYALIGLAAGLGLFGLYLWRLRHLRRMQHRLQRHHDLLEARVAERTAQLRTEIEERKRMEIELRVTHRRLLGLSREAGMAEVATGVLHNVGNVLNSVNVSASVVSDMVKGSKVASLTRVAAMMQEHTADLVEFLTRDPKGQHIPSFLLQLAERLAADQTTVLGELAGLRKNVEHINEIVAMQQTHSSSLSDLEDIKCSKWFIIND
jgi:hypothetical protein